MFDNYASSTSPDSNIVTAVSNVSVVNAGYSAYESYGMKFGTAKKNGVIDLTTSTAVSRAIIVATGWEATDTISVGGADAQTPGKKYTEKDALQTLTFDFTATTDVNITFTHRGFLQSIVFYTAA